MTFKGQRNADTVLASHAAAGKVAVCAAALTALALAMPLPGFLSPAHAVSDGATTPPQREEPVRFSHVQHTLEGTLFWPSGDADFPAVVILAGSDRSRRGPLRMRIAKHFAAHDVAALVYDSPGTGASGGASLTQTRQERAVEALAAVDFLRGMPGIRASAVGLLGGSEGADVALIGAAQDPDLAFVIAVSGAMGVPIIDVLDYSAEKRGRDMGLDTDAINKAKTFKEIAYVFLSGTDILDWPAVESRVKGWNDGTWRTFIDITRQRKNHLADAKKRDVHVAFMQIINRFKREPWFGAVDVGNAVQQLAALDVNGFFALLESGRYAGDADRGLGDVGNIRCPVLAIWGEDDAFLPPKEAAAKLGDALALTHHGDYEIKLFPHASHVLTVPGSTSEFVPDYLETMTHWLSLRVGAEIHGSR